MPTKQDILILIHIFKTNLSKLKKKKKKKSVHFVYFLQHHVPTFFFFLNLLRVKTHRFLLFIYLFLLVVS